MIVSPYLGSGDDNSFYPKEGLNEIINHPGMSANMAETKVI